MDLKDGYGVIYFKGRPHRAHRVAWMLANGPIPDGLQVLHRCDNPPCVRPDHLFCGTHTDNMRDKVAKGRSAGQQVTHCPKGHPYEGDNLYRRPNGTRVCRACARVSATRSYAKRARAAGVQPRPTTHCKRGHAYNEVGYYLTAKGGRNCRACQRERLANNREQEVARNRAWYQANREQVNAKRREQYRAQRVSQPR